jgi:hypothetical protein
MANIQSEIKDLQEAINSPATPEAQKVVMRGILAKLQNQDKPTAKGDKYQTFGKIFGKASKTMLGNDNGKDVEKFYSKTKKTPTPKGIEVDFEFIEKYTPDYYTNSNVTMSDDLAKFIDGEMNDEDYQDTIVSEFGEIDVKEAKKLASEIDQELMLNAIEEYEEQTGKKYTKTKTLVSVDGKSKLNIKVPIKDLNEPKKSDTLGDYDCDELIEKEKAKAKKRKANALKKASEPKKTEATKNKERIERVADVVETNLEKRLAKNEVSVEEIRKLIDETESLLTKLKEALKKAH